MHIEQVDITDIGLLCEEPSEESLLSVGRNIVECLKNIGFAYLKHHGISERLQEDVYDISTRFFALDVQDKLRYERFVKTGYNGYTPVGGEKVSYANSNVDVMDLKECYDLHFLGEGKDYPDDLVPGFGTKLEQFSAACGRLTHRLLRALDVAMETGALLSNCHRRQVEADGGRAELRVLYYPPVPADVKPNAVRCARHTDYGTMTLLFQDSIGGLEVETSSGSWIPATPVPGTILVNIGDMMETWTSGRLKATYHRVLIPSQQLVKNLPRQSLAYFVQPDLGTMVAPIDGSTDKYPPVVSAEFMQRQFSATYPALKDAERKPKETATEGEVAK